MENSILTSTHQQNSPQIPLNITDCTASTSLSAPQSPVADKEQKAAITKQSEQTASESNTVPLSIETIPQPTSISPRMHTSAQQLNAANPPSHSAIKPPQKPTTQQLNVKISPSHSAAKPPQKSTTQQLNVKISPAQLAPKPTQDTAVPPLGEVIAIPVDQIAPNPNQPRKTFSEPSILKLADSINQFGIIQPITVRKIGHLYELVAGERRLRAAKELGWTTIPGIVTNVSEDKSAQISIIENILRENLNMFEQALAIETLIDTYGLTQEQVAQKLSNSQSYIANKLRLLRLSPNERAIICENNLTERHARAILRIQDENIRKNTLLTIIEQDLNVSESELLVESLLTVPSSVNKQKEPKIHQYKDTSTFINVINRALETAKSSNLDIKSRKIIGDTFTELTILIPNPPPEGNAT